MLRRYALRAFFVFLVLVIGYWAVGTSWVVLTVDHYYGKVTQEPRINGFGNRELALLAPGESVADTIEMTDFCYIPMTEFCRFNTADVHNTFSRGDDYCVSAYGWRFGWASMKPNLVEIVTPGHEQWSKCVEVGAPNGE